jgi:hypothetical protein
MPYTTRQFSVFKEPRARRPARWRREATVRRSGSPERPTLLSRSTLASDASRLVELTGFEPATSALQGRRSPN